MNHTEPEDSHRDQQPLPPRAVRWAGRTLEKVASGAGRLAGADREKLDELRTMGRDMATTPVPPPEVRSRGKITFSVLVAFATNVVTTVAKGIAAVLTGSSALLADTLHSVADTGTNFMLIVAQRRSTRRADLTHPYGYGAELFFWSLLAALGIFLAGGVLSIWEGIQQIREGGQASDFVLGYTVLGVGLATDVYSLIVAYKETGRDARKRGMSRSAHLRSTTDTSVATVYLQEVAAVVGGLLAVAGLAGHQITGSAIPDGLAAVAIGVLLAAVGYRLVRRNQDLLTVRSDSPIVLDRIRELVAGHNGVAASGRVITVTVGPHQLLVLAEFTPAPGAAPTGIVLQLRAQIRDVVPRAVDVFLMPVDVVGEPPRPSRVDPDYWLRRFPEPEQD